jgi:hypothetical protein
MRHTPMHVTHHLGLAFAMHTPCVSDHRWWAQLPPSQPFELSSGRVMRLLAAPHAIHARVAACLLRFFPLAGDRGVGNGLPAHATNYLPNSASNTNYWLFVCIIIMVRNHGWLVFSDLCIGAL